MSSSGENKPSIVFFGSGPVAAKSLELLATSFSVEAVITKPRPVHHKGEVPVLALAEKLGLNVVMASDKSALSEVIATQSFASRVAILIDFGIIVAQDVIDSFPLGIINSHFSLLPQWRGADPIAFSLLSGQKETGVSLMLLVQAMDEGPLLAQAPMAIEPTYTITTLTDSLIELSYVMLQQIVPEYISGNVSPAPQEAVSIAKSTTPSYSRKLSKQDAVLDFSKPAEVLEREIRAYIEWPKSKTQLAGIAVSIIKAHVVENTEYTNKAIGSSVILDNKKVGIVTSRGILAIDELKPAGKKAMTSEAFLNGYGKNL